MMLFIQKEAQHTAQAPSSLSSTYIVFLWKALSPPLPYYTCTAVSLICMLYRGSTTTSPPFHDLPASAQPPQQHRGQPRHFFSPPTPHNIHNSTPYYWPWPPLLPSPGGMYRCAYEYYTYSLYKTKGKGAAGPSSMHIDAKQQKYCYTCHHIDMHTTGEGGGVVQQNKTNISYLYTSCLIHTVYIYCSVE